MSVILCHTTRAFVYKVIGLRPSVLRTSAELSKRDFPGIGKNICRRVAVSSGVMRQNKDPFVTVEWLKNKLDTDPTSIRILDAQWHLPDTKRIGAEEYARSHIPGALHFDLDDCSDQKSEYAHMLPKPEDFASYVGTRGISNSSHVVLYDNHDEFGIFSAPRVWWMFRVFGHQTTLISILHGGFPAWVKAGFDTTAIVPEVATEKYTATYESALVKSLEDMRGVLQEKRAPVLDARGSGRFGGTLPEPREGIKSGHIRGAQNLPYQNLINKEAQRFKEPEEIKAQFQLIGVDPAKPVVATCGSGVSACMLALGAYVCGNDQVPVYDGSWNEWYLRAKPEEKEDVPE